MQFKNKVANFREKKMNGILNMNKKKITLGTLSTITAIAVPIATVASCGEEKQKTVGCFKVETQKNAGLKTNYQLLEKQDDKNIQEIMKNVNGKMVFKDANNLDIDRLKTVKKVMLNITLSDFIKQNLKIEFLKEKHEQGNSDSYEGEIKIGTNNKIDKEFLLDLVENKDKTKAQELAKILNKLKHDKNFEVVFNLVLPKWIETDFKNVEWKIGINGHYDYVVDKIEKISGANTNLKRLFIAVEDMTNFDFASLPRQMKDIMLGGLAMRHIDPTSLPKGMERLDLGVSLAKNWQSLTETEKKERAKFIEWIKKNRSTIQDPDLIFLG